MEIKRIKVGFIHTNCYIIIEDQNCLIVDPGAEYKKIEDAVGNLTVVGILVTHHHPDHVLALRKLINKYKVEVYDIKKSIGEHKVDPFTFDIIHTPGHTNDSISFYFKDDSVLFSGDFLFKGTIGRTDLPTGSDTKIMNSLKMIREYDPNIIIYPGHGSSSTLGDEIKYNPYFKKI